MSSYLLILSSHLRITSCSSHLIFSHSCLGHLITNLSQVSIHKGLELEEQYPLRCTYSANFMPERTTKKVVVYRSNLRLASGQHEVWCNIEAASHVKWNRNGACRAHVEKRQDKTTKDNYILRLIPENLSTKPRMCKTQVVIDHYKFIAGVTKHLMERMNSYRKLGLTWWKQSLEILKDIKARYHSFHI